MKKQIKAFNSLLELIGDSPLVRLNRSTSLFNGQFFAKYEAHNPGH